MLTIDTTVIRLFDDIRVVVRYLRLRRRPAAAMPQQCQKTARKDATFIKTQPFF